MSWDLEQSSGRRSAGPALAGLGFAVLLAGFICSGCGRRDASPSDASPQVSAQADTHSPAHDDSHAGHDHSGHGHDHAHHGHDHGSAGGHGATQQDHESNALRLSAEALRSAGVFSEQIRTVELSTFWRALSLPAQVTGRDGRTDVQVATPMTGIITDVFVTEGAAVSPGTQLFRIRLTHEDLLQLQTEFLQTIEELDVEEREIRRLTKVTESQAIPGRLLLEREYQRDRLTALLEAQQESLRLHGLTDDHLKSIVEKRHLIRELRIFAPDMTRDADAVERHQLTALPVDAASAAAETELPDHPMVLEQLNVHQGQVVSAGTTLCVLKDYSELLIEGYAFEQNVPVLRDALDEKREVVAVFAGAGRTQQVVGGLQIEYLANEIDAESRSIRFFVPLSNQPVSDHQRDDLRFVEWRWLVGQRVRLRVPMKRWKHQIVLPTQAVAQEGSDSFVFRKHGEHFDRVAIRVKYRDALYVVVERDGAISPGNEIAWTGAAQLQMALRRGSSAPVDPHHGHNH